MADRRLRRALRISLWPAYAAFLLAVPIVGWLRGGVECGSLPAPTLEELVDRADQGEPVGAYRQRHLYYAPWVLVRSARSVSVVTQYWGTPPDDLGLYTHDDRCDAPRTAGTVELQAVVGISGRPWPMLDAPDDATTEAELTAAFGTSVAQNVGFWTHVLAVVQLWWPPLLFYGIVVPPAVVALVRAPRTDRVRPPLSKRR